MKQPTILDKVSPKTFAALQGMPPSDVATVVNQMEHLVQMELRGRFAFLRWGRAIKILRAQIQALALEVARLQNSAAASDQQASLYRNIIQVMGQPRDLAVFMKQEFPSAWSDLSAKGLKHAQIAQEIMLQLKEGKQVG
jgi:hypothetical protein